MLYQHNTLLTTKSTQSRCDFTKTTNNKQSHHEGIFKQRDGMRTKTYTVGLSLLLLHKYDVLCARTYMVYTVILTPHVYVR